MSISLYAINSNITLTLPADGEDRISMETWSDPETNLIAKVGICAKKNLQQGSHIFKATALAEAHKRDISILESNGVQRKPQCHHCYGEVTQIEYYLRRPDKQQLQADERIYDLVYCPAPTPMKKIISQLSLPLLLIRSCLHYPILPIIFIVKKYFDFMLFVTKASIIFAITMLYFITIISVVLTFSIHQWILRAPRRITYWEFTRGLSVMLATMCESIQNVCELIINKIATQSNRLYAYLIKAPKRIDYNISVFAHNQKGSLGDPYKILKALENAKLTKKHLP